MIRFLFCCLLCLPLFTSPRAISAQAQTCPDTLPSQLIIGEQAQVTPGSSNNLRAAPTTSAERIGQISAGTVVNVLEGPVCADGFAWWRVETLDAALNGWTVEAVEGAYALVPPAEGFTAAPLEGEIIAYEGAQITLPPTLGISADAVLAESIIGTDLEGVYPGEEWLTQPEGIHFLFNPTASAARFDNRIAIFPLPAYMRLNPHFAEDIFILQDLLETRPTPDFTALSRINFVDFMAQVLEVKGSYLETEQFIGVRYVTAFAQEALPVVRDSYVFYGISRDGRYFVDMQMLLLVDALPATFADISEQTWTVQGGFTDGETYYADINVLLESLPPEAYQPSLTALDALAASITLAPDTLADYAAEIEARGDQRVAVPDLDYAACDNPDFPARLTVGGAAQLTLPADVSYLTAEVVPGGGQTGWGGLPIQDIAAFYVMDGPVCHNGSNYWLLYTGRWAGWFPEMGFENSEMPMAYFFEPVDLDPEAVPLPPMFEGQTVTDCRLVATSVSILRTAPNVPDITIGGLEGGATYYADALFRRPEGGYLYWRLTPGVRNNRGDMLEQVVWVNSINVSPSPECANLPVIESP
jgi:hypothetical protein